MKKIIIVLILSFIFSNGFTANPAEKNPGRYRAKVNKEKLKDISFITDISPEVWRRLSMPHNARLELDYQKIDHPPGYYINAQSGYVVAVNYVSVEITVMDNGRKLSAKSTGEKLTAEQKNILAAADSDSEIDIKIRFRFKSIVRDKDLNSEMDFLGELTVDVAPETEAEFHLGCKKIPDYIIESVSKKISEPQASQKIMNAVVKFTVNEAGSTVDAKVLRTSSDPEIDKLLLEVIKDMPKWKPAESSTGEKVKQTFRIVFNDGC